jgi:hypothetical protein
MSMASLLPDELHLQPQLSHSESSLLAPSTSTPGSSGDLIPQKSGRRLSLGVLHSAKFRLSHDVRPAPVPVPSSLFLSNPIRT